MKNVDLKASVLVSMSQAMKQFRAKLKVLEALDACETEFDAYDLNDQILYLRKYSARLVGLLEKSAAVNGVKMIRDENTGEWFTGIDPEQDQEEWDGEPTVMESVLN